MKNMKSSVATFITVLSLGITGIAHAAQPSVIDSADVARNAMLDMSVSGSAYYTAASMDYTYTAQAYYTNVVGTNAEDVLGKLNAFHYNLRITNPKDSIQGYEYVDDAAGNPTFEGYVEFPQTNNTPTFELYLEDVYLSGTGVSSAAVLALNPDGTTADQNSLTLQNGEVVYSPWLLGAPNGLLVETLTNGSVLTFPVANPTAGTVGDTEGEGGFKIQGHYVAKDPGSLQIIETYNLPTAFIQLTSPTVLANGVTFDVTGVVQANNGGTYFDRPLAMWVMEEGTGAPPPYKVNFSQNSPTIYKFPSLGTYRVWFEWARFGQPGLLYTGPTDGGKA